MVQKAVEWLSVLTTTARERYVTAYYPRRRTDEGHNRDTE